MILMRISSYIVYISVSTLWLLLELSLTRYVQYPGVLLLGILINVISMVIASYKPIHNYLFLANTALLIYMGFTIPPTLSIIYSVLITVGIVLYLLLTGLIKPLPLLMSLLMIYVSYIVSRALIKLSAIGVLSVIISNSGLRGDLFAMMLVWYLSLLTISIAIIIIVVLLARRLRH